MMKRKDFLIRKNEFTAELVLYIKNKLKKGYTKESLKWALINQGYSKIEVDKALKKVDFELAVQAPELKTKPQIRHQIISPPEYAGIIKITKKPFWKKIFDLD